MIVTAETYHVPVLLTESVDGLAIKPNGTYVDVTFGGGGHSREILRRLGPGGRLFSFDQDADAEKNILGDAGLRARIGGGWQLVLANIVADVIIPLSAQVRQFMAPEAVFICSGIIENRWPETEAALKANGFEILDHRSEEEWHCFVCR